MENDPLPRSDHIARYCPRGKCNERGNPTGAAFMLRSDEEYLSVDWLEQLHPTSRITQVSNLRAALSKRLQIGSSAIFAVLQISSMCDYISCNTGDSRELEVLHHPYDNDPSHSGIHNFSNEDSLIADLIAEIVEEIHSAA